MQTAILLAAGRGERLRPLTDITPKPLCCFQGKPLLAYHLENLHAAGFEHIIINHAHLGDQIRRYILQMPIQDMQIDFSPEPPGALETGGGLYNIIQRFGLQQPFLCVNTDIYTQFPFQKITKHSLSHALAHIILVPNPNHNPQGDFGISSEQYLLLESPRYTMAGITQYHPDLWTQCKPGRYSITPIIKQFIKTQKITGEIYDGTWIDIGAPERLNNQEFL